MGLTYKERLKQIDEVTDDMVKASRHSLRNSINRNSEVYSAGGTNILLRTLNTKMSTMLTDLAKEVRERNVS